MAGNAEQQPGGPLVLRRSLVFWAGIGAASLTPPVQWFLRLGGLRGVQDAISYLTQTEQRIPSERVNLILGDHHLPEPSGDADKAVWEPYVTKGDLSKSLWRVPEQEMVAKGMREAYAAGRPYIIVVDGQVPNVPYQNGESVMSLPMIPLPPKLSEGRPKDMPENFYVVSAEPMDRFGLDAKALFPDNEKLGKAVETIGDEIYSRYDPYNQATNKKVDGASNAQASTDNTFLDIEVEALAVGAISQLGRKITPTGAVASTAAILASGGIAYESNVIAKEGDNFTLANNLGADTSLEAQRRDTVIANATGEDTQDPFSLWAIARTALGYEKAQGILQHPTIYAKPPTPPVPATSVDLLYGSYHNVKAPEVMEDEGFRKQTIQSFLSDLLSTAKKTIEKRATSSDSDIAKEFSNPQTMFYLLTTVASSLCSGRITKITIPWGQASIDPNLGKGKLDSQKVIDFENAHAEVTQGIYSLQVQQWVYEGLEAFLIAQNVPYDRNFFHPEATPTPPRMTPTPIASTSSRRDFLRAVLPIR